MQIDDIAAVWLIVDPDGRIDCRLLTRDGLREETDGIPGSFETITFFMEKAGGYQISRDGGGSSAIYAPSTPLRLDW